MSFNFIVGIDFGDSSTSFSYACEDNENFIGTVKDWPQTDEKSFGGRVPSCCLYKTIDGLPLWGGYAEKRHFKSGDLFHASNIKSYLTDPDYQRRNPLPDGLNPIKIAADYLQQVHGYGVEKMKEHFKSNDAEQTGDPQKDDNADTDKKIVDNSQIRYVISYPDNQKEKGYIAMMTEVLELAGIASLSDPPGKLSFTSESEATAYACTVDDKIKCPRNPYIICALGRTSFGISTIQADELAETGTIEPQFEQSSSKCGSTEPDRNMRRYLDDNISTGDGDLDLLKRAQEEVLEFYVERIMPFYDDNTEDSPFEIPELGNTIRFKNFVDGDFNFSHEDLRNQIFGPVSEDILNRIGQVIDKLGKSPGGIIISGTIGHDNYLPRMIYNKFGNDETKATLMMERRFAVSRGLILFGFRENGRMVPYLNGVTFGKTNKIPTAKPDTHASVENKTIDFSNVKYVIGLDFGTSFSGLAIAKAEHWNDPNADHNFVIHEFKNWPKQKNKPASKTPSLLYYTKDGKSPKFGIYAKYASNSPDSDGILLRHFKLLLSREYDGSVDDRQLKDLKDFEVIHAIRDYLCEFNKKAIDGLRDMGYGLTSDNVGYIVTIPTMWSDEAKNTMRVAVRDAGLVKKEDINTKVHFITEAEAAAMYCERYYNGFSMEIGQKFMICDAGGGTVDLVTFQVIQDKDGGKLISEIAAGSGGNCGSVFLDENFRDYIVKKFDDNHINKTHEGINQIVDHFIDNIKPNFESEVDADLEEDFKIPVPSECLIYDIVDIPGFIEDDHIVIKYADIENDIFKPVITKVLDLIDSQLQKLNEKDRRLDALLVVGGFGKSSYLLRKIEDRFKQRSVGAEVIGTPPNGDLSICKGAVSFGLYPRMVSEGLTRFSYGLQVKDKLGQRQADDPAQRIVGPDGSTYCQNVFSPIVSKESYLQKGHIYIQQVHVTYPNDPVFAIYSTELQDPPRLTTEMGDYILKVTAKMPILPDKDFGDKVSFEMWFEISSTDINVDIVYNGEKLTQGVTKNLSIVRKKFVADASQKGKTGQKTRAGFFYRKVD